jgi:hypothetical protein
VDTLASQIAGQITTVTNALSTDDQSYTTGLFGTGCTFDDVMEGLKGVYSVASGIAEADYNIANQIVDMMWEMNQALQYYTVIPSTLPISEIDIGTLTNAQAGLATNLTHAIAAAGQSGAAFKDLGYTIPTPARSAAMNQLSGLQMLNVTFNATDSDQPFGTNGFVTVTGLSVTLTGLTSTDPNQTVNVVIAQTGPDTRYNCDTGQYMSVCHESLMTEYQYVPATGDAQISAEFGSTDTYTGASPCATWGFDFTAESNQWINWSEVQSVVITFSGTMTPPPPPPVKK